MKKRYWFLLSFFLVLLDQGSKYWAVKTLLPYHPWEILPVLNFTLAYNTGAAFSFLSSAGEWHRWFFAVFSLVMSGILSIWLWRLPRQDTLTSAGLSLILGGAVGNLYDRAAYGWVIDFIQLHYNQYAWPVFNLADTAICIGAGLLFSALLTEKKNTSRQKRPSTGHSTVPSQD